MILNNLSPRSTFNDYISFQIYFIPISFFFLIDRDEKLVKWMRALDYLVPQLGFPVARVL